MNIKVILYLLGKISMLMGIIMFVPVTMAAYYQEDGGLEFGLAAILSVILGYFFQQHGQDAGHNDISVREGIGTVFFSWVLAAMLAGLPYWFMGILDPISAYFESMSGLTTTGATAIADLEVLPRSVLFWRSMTHWIGGIGIIVLFVALLPQIAGSAVYLFNAEVSGFTNSRILPRIRTTAIALFYIYLSLTVVLAVILNLLGMSVYDAVNHSCSAIATGGFSTYNNSVAHFQSASIEYVIGIFMVIAAGNFSLYYQITQSGIRTLWEDLEFKTYIFILTVVTIMITANIVYVNGYSLLDGFRSAFFQVSSFGSTTGYVSDDYDKWPSFAKLLLAVMYFTGGCAGSTAGGIKISRFIVLMKMVAAELRCALHPQMLLNVYYDKRRLPVQTVVNISRFFFVYILVIAILSMVLTMEGLTVEEAVFGVASCISSVDSAFDSIGATSTYAAISPLSKLALALAMLLGRLELFTVLALLRSEYWRSSKRW